MFCFELDEDTQLLVDGARRFGLDVLRPAARVAEKTRQVPAEVCSKFADLGLGAICLPETLGGLGGSLCTQVCVQMALAEGDAAQALALPQPGPFGRLLQALKPPEALLTAALQPFVDAPHSACAALACSEVGCPDLPADTLLTTRAMAHPDGYLLRGSKDFVLGHAGCHHVLVLAQLGEGPAAQGISGAAFFLLPGDAKGMRFANRETLVGLEVLHGGKLTLEDVLVPRQACLGAGNLLNVLDDFYAQEGLLVAASLAGLMQASYTYALAYAQGRQAFGKPIAYFQSIAFLLADMHMQCESLKWSVTHAAWSCQQGTPDAMYLMQQARAQAEEAAFFVTDQAVQILGGHGYIQDHPVEKWMRDARMLSTMYGSGHNARCRAAHALLHGHAACSSELLPLGCVQPVWT